MRQRVAQLLVCPLDRTPLELVAWEVERVPLAPADRAKAEALGIAPETLETDVRSGVLVNRGRRVAYPIYRGVPRMLTFPTGVAGEFTRELGERLRRELPGVSLPAERPMPGEEDVLRTFSREWLDYEWDGRSYWNMTPEHTYRCMDFMLDLADRPARGGRVLEVGIGVGGIADHVARSQECELVGVDLSYAVDAARRHFGRNPFLHVVQASAFALPFADASFDLVYSHGVLHHTFDTRTAVERVSRLPRRGGRLYVWVYSREDEERTPVRRTLMLMERVLRPVLWRLPTGVQTAALLPIVPLYLLNQNLLGGSRQPGNVRYGVNEALHAARDRFTPRYVHRHGNDEVGGWFRLLGYEDVRYVTDRVLPPYLPPSFAHCTGVDGVRR
ncbi:MAG TPA: methyltransferase domain-containing protein [Gemmatimonadales bacterium]|nr:methyltransferase domain-containing protein [Gemmatimonadales bacterium]